MAKKKPPVGGAAYKSPAGALMAASKAPKKKQTPSLRSQVAALPDSTPWKVNSTGTGPRAGMKYREFTDALGRTVHDYGSGGVVVVPKKKRLGS